MMWGVAWPAGRIVSQELPAFTAAFLRFSMVFPLLFLFTFFLRVPVKHEKSVLFHIMLLGFFQVTLYNTLFLTGVKYTSASDAVLIISVNPVLTSVLASFRYPDEKLSLNKLLGLLLSLLGVALIAYRSPNTAVENRLLGDVIIFFAALTWAIYTVFSRPLYKRVHPLAFNAWSTFFGWVFLGILAFREKPWAVHPSFKVTISLIYLGVFGAAIANTIFSTSIKNIGSSRTAVFVNLVPIFGILSSVVILREETSFIYVVSFIIIVSGIYLVQRERATVSYES